MRIPLLLAALLTASSCAATVKTDTTPTPPQEADAEMKADEAVAAKEEKPVERKGVLVPGEHDAISLWPEAYAGELLVLEALPQGTVVEEGDVVARLETRWIEEQIRDAKVELSSAKIKHDGQLEKNAIAAEAAAAKLARTRAALDRARRSYEGFLEYEQAFSKRSDDMSRMREANWTDDQKDELAQLEAMYEADELVDATEEIVLKRSRRDLAMREAANVLSEDRRRYSDELTEMIQAEQKKEAVQVKELELEHLIRTQAVDKVTREDAENRSAIALGKKEEKLARLERDLELFNLRAPRAGILLHGAAKDYKPGSSPRMIERGSTLSKRADAMVVADPAKLAVGLNVPESMLKDMENGAMVVAKPVATDAEIGGKLTLAAYPSSQKGEDSTFAGTVMLDEASTGLVVGTHVVIELKKPEQ